MRRRNNLSASRAAAVTAAALLVGLSATTSPPASAGADAEPARPDSRHAPDGASHTLSQAENMEAVLGYGAACWTERDTTAETASLRVFELEDHGITTGFDVVDVDVSIEVAEEGQEVTVNVYSLEGDLAYENMTLLGSGHTTLDYTWLYPHTVPVTGTVPAGGTLVVEVVAAEGWFWIGANDYGQTAPWYSYAEECTGSEIVEHTSYAAGIQVTGTTTAGAGPSRVGLG